MGTRARIITIWTLAGVLILLTLALVGRPMAIAWNCYNLNASGERADAEVVHKLDSPVVVAQIGTGPRAGQSCTAKTSAAHHEALEVGDPLAIVYLAHQPDECVLVSTLDNSILAIWALAGGIAGIILLILAGALVVHRSLTATPFLTSWMDVDGKRMVCPQCDAEMEEGYLAVLAGLHWRRPGEPIGVPHALSGLPGTVGWRARPRLHAFRCPACDIITFKYGSEPRRS